MSIIIGLILLMIFAIRPLKMPKEFAPIVHRKSVLHGIPANLIAAIITVESGWNPDAKGAAGEIGLMQILPATARQMGFAGPESHLFLPNTNIHFGVKYLAYQKSRFGLNDKTIAAYNSGTPRTRIDGKFINQAYVDKVKSLL